MLAAAVSKVFIPSVTSPFPFAALTARFAAIIVAVCGTVAARAARERALASLLMLVWKRLRGMATRFAAVARRADAGRAQRAGASPKRQRVARPSGPRERLPQGFAWLLRLVPEAAPYGGQLQHLLSDPDFAALLAATPGAARVVRSLCRMLGVDPALLAAVERKVRTPARGDPPDRERKTHERRVDAAPDTVRARRAKVPRSFNRPWLRWRPANVVS